MSETVRQFGVIGHPIAHSWSPFIHGLFAQQTGVKLTYRLFDVAPDQFRKHVLEFFANSGDGLNVTVPHKLAAVEIANRLAPRAELAGAANTLSLRNGEIIGDNTDGTGLVCDLRQNLGLALGGRRMLIIGAGGAARGVIAPLLALGPTELVIANRTAERAKALAEEFAGLGEIRGCGFDQLPADGAFNLIINATAAGLKGEMPSVPQGTVDSETVCYDMTYGPSETPFLRWAVQAGCGRAVPGWGMLVEQAAESFHVWHGMRPQTAPVIAALAQKRGPR
jgi:shikimate dehydrogenase